MYAQDALRILLLAVLLLTPLLALVGVNLFRTILG
jgi:hypothetical protein